jgi:hypothetical protein
MNMSANTHRKFAAKRSKHAPAAPAIQAESPPLPPVAVREYHELRRRESLEAMRRRIDVSHKAGAYDIDYKKT